MERVIVQRYNLL